MAIFDTEPRLPGGDILGVGKGGGVGKGEDGVEYEVHQTLSSFSKTLYGS